MNIIMKINFKKNNKLKCQHCKNKIASINKNKLPLCKKCYNKLIKEIYNK